MENWIVKLKILQWDFYVNGVFSLYIRFLISNVLINIKVL